MRFRNDGIRTTKLSHKITPDYVTLNKLCKHIIAPLDQTLQLGLTSWLNPSHIQSVIIFGFKQAALLMNHYLYLCQQLTSFHFLTNLFVVLSSAHLRVAVAFTTVMRFDLMLHPKLYQISRQLLV